MAENDGSIAIGLSLDINNLKNDINSAQANIQKMTTEFKKQGVASGKVYVEGTGKGIAELNKKLNSFVDSMGSISPKMGKLGGNIAAQFSKPLLSAIPKIALAFSTMLPVIALIGAAIAVVVKAFSGAVKAQKEFSDNVKKSKEAQAALAGTVEKSNKAISGQQKSAAVLNKIFGGLIGILDTVKNGISFIADGLGNLISKAADWLGIMSVEEQEAAANAQLLVEQNNALIESYKANGLELKNIETALESNAITAEEADSRKLTSAENYLQKLIELRNEIDSQDFNTSREVAEYDKAIAAQVRLRDSYAQTVKANEDAKKSLNPPKEEKKEETRQDKITAAREAAIKRYNEAVRKANDEVKAGLIDEEEHRLKLHRALETEYSDLEAIVAEYKLSTGATINLRNEVTKKVLAGRAELGDLELKKLREKDIAEILKSQVETLEEQRLAEQLASGDLQDQIEYENKLIELERARERAALEARLTSIGASEKERGVILGNFDTITEGMLKSKEAAEEADKSLEAFFSSAKWNQGMQIATAAVDTFTSIANTITQAQVAAIEAQVDEIDKMLDAELERIEEMRQRALEEAGFAEATTQESLQAKLDAAVEAGDQILAYEYQRRLEEKAINDQFDAQAKAAEEKAAREKAQLEYKAAKIEWEMSLAQAGLNLATALMNAVVQGSAWPLVMGGPPVGIPLFTVLAAAAGGTQVGFIAANPPKPPAFESGGLVPGLSFSGDNVLASVNSGERILTMDNQEFMLAAAGAAGGNKVVTIVVPVYLNGTQIAEAVAEEVNTARVMLDERGIRRR